MIGVVVGGMVAGLALVAALGFWLRARTGTGSRFWHHEQLQRAVALLVVALVALVLTAGWFGFLVVTG